MNLKKKELIITIIMIVTLLVIGINASVFASTSLTWPTGNNTTTNTTTNSNIIERVNTANVTPNTTNNVNNATNNTPGQLANTGLEDAPWLIIGICVISAVFAYNKIKEYKSF